MQSSKLNGSSLFALVLGLLAACSTTPVWTAAGTEDMASSPDMSEIAEPQGALVLTNVSAAQMPPGISVSSSQEVLVGQIILHGLSGVVKVESLTLTLTGSIGAGDLSGFTIQDSLGNKLSSAGPGGSAGSKVVFERLTGPLVLDKGKSTGLGIFAKIARGVLRNFQLVFGPDDIVAYDVATGQRIQPVLNTGSFPVKLSYVSIDHVIASASASNRIPSPRYIIPGVTNQSGGALYLQAGNRENVEFTGLSVNLKLDGGISSEKITNLRLVDRAGNPLGSAVAKLPPSDPRGSYTFSLSVPIGSLEEVELRFDLAAGVPLDSTVNVSYSDITANGLTSSAKLTLPNVTGTHLIVSK